MAGCPIGILVDLSEPVTEVCPPEMLDLCPDPVAVSPPQPMDVVVLEDPCQNGNDDDTAASLDSVEFIDEEEYDFNLPGTPTTSSESADSADDEEVFFGAVSHMERCIATAVNTVTEVTKPMSPLNPHQFAEICKEANKVASRISSATTGTRKRKAVGKENLSCAKQLILGAVISKPSPKVMDKLLTRNCSSPVSNLLKSVSRMQMEEGDKNCDTSEAGSLLNNSVIVNEKQMNETKEMPSEGGSLKRHIRSKTYLVNNIPESLPSNEKRKSVPAIDTVPLNGICTKKSKLDLDQVKQRRKSEQVAKLDINKSKLGIDERKGNSKLAAEPPKQRSFSRLQKPKATSGPFKQPASTSQKPVAEAPAVTKSEITKPRSRLSAPTAGTIPAASCLPKSKLAQTKSGIPAVKGLAPISKLQPLKPSGLKRCGSFQQKASEGMKRTGPLKAFAPVGGQKGNKPEPAPLVTPLKANTQVQRKNLSSSFTSGNESRTNKVPESPSSSVTKRRSCLPTPTKSRSGSGSLSSPSRSSTSSSRSQESPLIAGTTSIGKRRQSSSLGRYRGRRSMPTPHV